MSTLMHPRFSLSMACMMRPSLLNKGNVCTKLFKLLGPRRPSFRYKMPIIICVKIPLFPGKARSGVQWVSWVYISSNNISADKQKQVWGEKRGLVPLLTYQLQVDPVHEHALPTAYGNRVDHQHVLIK